MMKENTVIKEVPFITSPLEGEDACKAGEGVIHTVSPSFVLRTFSPSRGEINQGSIARGFTLIELLVVVLIIGILAAVALPQYQKAVYKSHYTKLKAIVKSIADAEEVYYLANGQYTADLDELDVNLPPYNQVSNKIYYYDWGDCWAVGAARIFCYTNKSNMGYSIYFKYLPEEYSDLAGKQTCHTYAPTNSIQGKICQAESGLTTYSKGDDTNNQYTW